MCVFIATKQTGVVWADGRWQAQTYCDSRKLVLGKFQWEEAAARRYDEKARELWTNARTNFLPVRSGVGFCGVG